MGKKNKDIAFRKMQTVEFETWWFNVLWFKEKIKDNTIETKAPARIARVCAPDDAEADKNGNVPYVITSKNPNGALSVATIGITYEIPLCRVSISG